ncbi:MAG: pentapeptide repeat-containing protein [Proteobacteria bacterium]|nr:pentapeptide repeat-containing protein [Pseudomonadota bacterium]
MLSKSIFKSYENRNRTSFARIAITFSGLFWVLTVALLISNNAIAYDRYDYDRLMKTGNCVGCDLSSVKINKMDLSGSDLRGANLNNAQMQGTNLYKADLFGTILSGADLSFAHWTDGSTCRAKSIGFCR